MSIARLNSIFHWFYYSHWSCFEWLRRNLDSLSQVISLSLYLFLVYSSLWLSRFHILIYGKGCDCWHLLLYIGAWLEFEVWLFKQNCDYDLSASQWCSSVYAAVFKHPWRCSPLHCIHLYFRGATLSLFSNFLFLQHLYWVLLEKPYAIWLIQRVVSDLLSLVIIIII